LIPILIYSGTNQRAVIAFCRYAKRLNLPISIVANGSHDTIFLTDFADNVLLTRPKNELTVTSVIAAARETMRVHSSDQLLILPSTEYLNRFLLKHVGVLSQNGISTGLCEESLYQMISDKFTFSRLCESKGITVPREFETMPTTFPFVVKPRSYGKDLTEIHEKPILVYSEKDLKKLDKIGYLSNYYFQEYVGGKSFYLLYYFYKNGSFSVFSQENLIQQDNGASIILAKSSRIHEEGLGKRFADVFIACNFSGLVMVEIKKYRGQDYMIEANPRFWGPSQLILDSNMSLIDDFLVDNSITTHRNISDYRDGVPYFWSGGLVQDQSARNSPKFYDYTPDRFFAEYAELYTKDVYLRKDTIKIYIDECCSEGFSSTIREKQ
jgi:predicted ATP-grasp superfamily ATP-dependent carboligase